jgi:hypothetical protein
MLDAARALSAGQEPPGMGVFDDLHSEEVTVPLHAAWEEIPTSGLGVGGVRGRKCAGYPFT